MIRAILHRALYRVRALLPPDDGGIDTARMPAPQRAQFFAHYEAACKRLDGATQLREAGKSVPALLLYREAFWMLARSQAFANAKEGELVGADGQAAIDRFIESLASKHPTAGRILNEDLVTSNDWLAVDALGPRELDARVAEIAEVAPDVLLLVTPRTPERQRRARSVRRAFIVLGLLASAIVIVVTLVRPENIALHKPATSSSAALNTKPAGAVNGRIYEQYGFHSDPEESPWLRVDLEKRYDITRILVHGRHDCCLDQSIPMVVELSDDGVAYRSVAERSEAFDQLDPWEIKPDLPLPGRFVRVRSLKSTVLVLTEVEVYGRPAR